MNWRICIVAIFSSALVSPAPAFASTWVYINKNVYESVYEVDWDSIRRDGNVVTFTLRTQYGPKSPPSEEDGYVSIRTADCSTRVYSDLQTDYMKNGAILRSTGKDEARQARPESIAAAVLDKVCAQ